MVTLILISGINRPENYRLLFVQPAVSSADKNTELRAVLEI